MIFAHRPDHRSDDGDLAGLVRHLSLLVGEPFHLARFSYGEELTMHFGEMKPTDHPKLRHLRYGSFILGTRASTWVLKSPDGRSIVSDKEEIPGESWADRRPRKRAVEDDPLIRPGSRVVSAEPFAVRDVGVGLRLAASDGSALTLVPAGPEAEVETNGADDLPPEYADLPVADWELFTPAGTLSAGPGVRWSFEPSRPRSARDARSAGDPATADAAPAEAVPA